MKILYKTSLADKKDGELKAISLGNEVSLRELLIRSVNDYFPAIGRDSAVTICDSEIKKQPTHNLFNLIRGCHEQNIRKKIDYFTAAAQSLNPCGKEVSSQAAFELAKLYMAENKFLEAQAWLLRAILNGSDEATQAFLGVYIKKDALGLPWYRLGKFSGLTYKFPESECQPAYSDAELKKLGVSDSELKINASRIAMSDLTFLSIILSGNEIVNLKKSGFYVLWHKDLKKLIMDANKDCKNALNNALIPGTTVNALLKNAAWFNPNMYVDFFTYSVLNNIIADEVYLKAMEYFLTKIPNPAHDPALKTKLEDKAFYSLYKFNLYRKEQLKADACFKKISPQFNEFKVRDFNKLPASAQDRVTYQIFKRLHQCQHYKEALLFLNNIKNMNSLDATIFDFFQCADPNETKYEIQQFRKWLLNNIIQTTNPNFERSFFDRVIADSIALNNKVKYIHLEFIAIVRLVEEYMEIREQRKKENPNRTWRYDNERASFLASAKALTNTLPKTKQQCEAILNEYTAFITSWKKKLSGPHIAILFSTVLNRLEDIKNQIDKIQDKDFITPEKTAVAATTVQSTTPETQQYLVPTNIPLYHLDVLPPASFVPDLLPVSSEYFTPVFVPTEPVYAPQTLYPVASNSHANFLIPDQAITTAPEPDPLEQLHAMFRSQPLEQNTAAPEPAITYPVVAAPLKSAASTAPNSVLFQTPYSQLEKLTVPMHDPASSTMEQLNALPPAPQTNPARPTRQMDLA